MAGISSFVMNTLWMILNGAAGFYVDDGVNYVSSRGVYKFGTDRLKEITSYQQKGQIVKFSLFVVQINFIKPDCHQEPEYSLAVVAADLTISPFCLLILQEQCLHLSYRPIRLLLQAPWQEKLFFSFFDGFKNCNIKIFTQIISP